MISNAAKYDEALFYQKLGQLAKEKVVSLTDLEVAFWHAAGDLKGMTLDQKPENLEEAEEHVREVTVPQLAEVVQEKGFIIAEYQKGN